MSCPRRSHWRKYNEFKTVSARRCLYVLKVHKCIFENLSISSSSYENNMSKISH